MSRPPPHSWLKLATLILPLCAGGVVWWLAGQSAEKTLRLGPAVAAQAAKNDSPAAWARVSSPLVEQPEVSEIFAKFESWAEDYSKSATSDTLAAGVKLAQQRRSALKTLIENDPKQALSRALPWRLRNQMPPEVFSLLEQRISTEAKYSVKGARQAPDVATRVKSVQRAVIIQGKRYDAFTYGRREWLGTKYNLPVEGIAVDNSLAMQDSPMRTLEPGEPLPAAGVQKAAQDEHQTDPPPAAPPVMVSGGKAYQACCSAHAAALEKSIIEAEESVGPNMGTDVAESAWTEGLKKILVIRVDFSDVPGVPKNINPSATITPAFATNLINGVTNTFMTEVSYGKTSVNLNTADVTPVLRMPRTASYYATNNDADGLQSDSLAAARTAGYDPGSYHRQMVVFSAISSRYVPGSDFNWAGLGEVGGPFTWYNGYFDDRVVPHELGHNLSLYHANLWQVPGSNPVADSGYSAPYEDPFDCMGNGFYAPINLLNFNPWFLNRIDWMPNSAVQTVNSPGVYRVYRFDHRNAPLTRTLALKITKDGSRNYWLSYRRKFAGVSGALADISAGAYVIWGYNFNTESDLIDASTPGTNAFDASLNVGSTLRDDDAGVVVKVESAGGSGLDEYLDIRITQANRVYPVQTVYDVDEAAGSVTIQLARSGEPNETTIARVATQDNTAVSPSDYTTVSTTVRWDGTDISPKSVTIPIIANSLREPAENFRVNITLEQTTSMAVAGSPVTVNIREPGMSDSTFVHGSFLNSGSVRSLVVQPDGSIAFGGGALMLGSAALNGIGRVGPSGQTDASFNRVNGAFPLPVLAMVRQPDGKFMVGGGFTSLRAVALNRVGRLGADGGIDSSFNPGSGANGTVRALAVQPDGRILVGGSFTSFDGTSRRGLARLMPDGALDMTFLAAPLPVSAMEVEAIALQPNGKILVGGLIRTATPNELFSGLSSGILRLNADGTVDTTFDIGSGAHLAGDPASPQRVMAIALQYDGKVLAGGAFTGFQGTDAPRLVRLNANGSLDEAFQTAFGSSGTNNIVRSVEIQGDGRILVAGEFTLLAGSVRYYVGRLLGTGALDANFDIQLPLAYPDGNPNIVYRTRMQPDAKILVAADSPGSNDSTLRRVFSGQPGRSGTVEFSSGSITVNEGGQANVEVRRTGGSLGEVSVSYDVLPDSAGTADYTALKGTLTWANGDTSPKNIIVQAVADGETEETEYFDIQLGVPMGGVSLGERAVTTVSIADPGAAGFATVRFTTDTSVLAEAATIGQSITVELSQAAAQPIIVPIILGGRATNAGTGTNGDYSIPTPLPLNFQPGQIAKTILVNSIPDKLPEGQETLTLRLGFPTGPALVGNPGLHTVSFVDDDQLPFVTSGPAHRMVELGAPAGPFEAQVLGSEPLTFQWYVNGKPVKGATESSVSIAAATLKDAGRYHLKAKNPLDDVDSPTAELAVVDTSVRTVVLAPGAKALFKADAGGNSLSYVWRKLEGPLPGEGRAVADEGKLTISGLKTSDSGTYVCRVQSPLAVRPNGLKYMDGTTYILKVADTAPAFHTLENGDALTPAIVSGTYNYQVEAAPESNRAPMAYAAAGLPPGLKIDPASGRITGKPTAWKSAPYDVTLTLSNKAGKASVKVKLTVSELPPGLAGDYVAVVGRKGSLNQNIGGRLDLKITATGAFSGKFVHGGVSHALKGVMDVSHPASTPPVALPRAKVVIVRTGKPAPLPLELNLEINPETKRIVAASVSDSFDSVAFTGWKQTWDAKLNKAEAFDGYHTFALRMPDSIPNVPRGHGVGTLNVSLAGVASIAGKTADGETITSSSFISETGEVALFQPLYKTKPSGSLLGKLQLDRSTLADDDKDNRVGGSLDWLRPETPGAARTYKAGFGPLDVSVIGGRYSPQTWLLGMAAAGDVKVTFLDAGPPPSKDPNATFQVGAKNKITPPAAGPAGTTLSADAAKGTFGGKFALEDANPRQPPPTVKRPATYQGLVVPTDEGLRGFGWFLLPQLPSASEVPPTTPTTSPILSGNVLFEVVVPPVAPGQD